MLNKPQVRTTFGSLDVEKVHAAVAQSGFRSQNGKSTPFSDHFWKLRCWKRGRGCGAKPISKTKVKNMSKNARGCGAKHISKRTWSKGRRFGPLWEVEMSKKCTRRESARSCGAKHMSKLKLVKTLHVRTSFDSFARSSVIFCGRRNGNVWVLNMHVAWQAQYKRHLHLQLQLQLHLPMQLQLQIRYTTLQYNTLHYTTLHYTKLHYTSLHYIHYTTLHYTKLCYTTQHDPTLHDMTRHCTVLHYTTLDYTTLH